MVREQERRLLGRFDAFGDDVAAQALAHADHRAHDGGVVRVCGDLVQERLVDFEHVDRKMAQVTETRVTGAEVVDRQAHADAF